MFIYFVYYILWFHVHFLLQNTQCFLLSEYVQRIRNQSLDEYSNDSKTISNGGQFTSNTKMYSHPNANSYLTGITRRKERAIFKYSDPDDYPMWRSSTNSYKQNSEASWQPYSRWLYRSQPPRTTVYPYITKLFDMFQTDINKHDFQRRDITMNDKDGRRRGTVAESSKSVLVHVEPTRTVSITIAQDTTTMISLISAPSQMVTTVTYNPTITSSHTTQSPVATSSVEDTTAKKSLSTMSSYIATSSVEDTTAMKSLSISPSYIATSSFEDTTAMKLLSITPSYIATSSVEDTTAMISISITPSYIATSSVEDTTAKKSLSITSSYIATSSVEDTTAKKSFNVTSSYIATSSVEDTTANKSLTVMPLHLEQPKQDFHLLGMLLALLTIALLLIILLCWCIYVYNARRHRNVTEWHTIGYLEDLYVYPVKSCGPIPLLDAQCTCSGLANGCCRDRFLMIIDNACQCLTVQRCPGMVTIKPKLKRCILTLCHKKMKPLKIDLDEICLLCPRTAYNSDNEVSVADCGNEARQWITRLIGGENEYSLVQCLTRSEKEPELVFENIFREGAPYHLVNQGTLDILNAMLPERCRVTAQNFRPNFVVKGATPFDEYNWSLIKIGTTIFEVLKPCSRCVVTTIDPETGQMNCEDEPLNTMKRCSKFCDKTGIPCMGLLLALQSEPLVSQVMRCDGVAVTYSDCGLLQVRSCPTLSRFKGVDQFCNEVEKRPMSSSHCPKRGWKMASKDTKRCRSPCRMAQLKY